MIPVFAYWHSDDHSALGQITAEWRTDFPQFRIFGDAEVIPLLERYFPQHLELYRKIRFPTAKSDLARWLLLYEYGGLYIDCHCGIRDADEIRRLLASLDEIEAIFIDRRLSQHWRHPDEHLVLSSIAFSRAHFPLMLTICGQGLANLDWLRNQERQNGRIDYNIWEQVGPGLVTKMLLEPASFNRDFRSPYQDRVRIIREEVAPIVRGRNETYRTPGQHWSERQKIELLFDT